MNLFISLFLMLFFNVFVGADDVATFDYCSVKCGEEPHTMCKYPPITEDFIMACWSLNATAGLTSDMKKSLLREHNVFRQKVARGDLKGQPRASNMMKLKWNNEAAEIAQRWANQCKYFEKDVCRTLKDGTSVGQSGFKLVSKGVPFNKSKIAADGINKWLKESKIVANIDPSNPPVAMIPEYTQLVWAETTDVGCGAVMEFHEEQDTESINVVCNYAPSGNVLTEEMYKVGEPGTECPEESTPSNTYPGLCLSAGNDETDDHIEFSRMVQGVPPDFEKLVEKDDYVESKSAKEDGDKTGSKEEENYKKQTPDAVEDDRKFYKNKYSHPFNDDDDANSKSENDNASPTKSSLFCTFCILLFVLLPWF